MILLRHDCLVFKTGDGEMIPCSAEQVTLEIIGDAVALLDEQTIKHASAAVLHYFKVDLAKTTVSIGEFTAALERALRALGLHVKSAEPAAATPPKVMESDLSCLAAESPHGFELMFFGLLRNSLQELLDRSPDVVRFHGLRGCVKQLRGARRWNLECQSSNDQIVEYLRSCFESEHRNVDCALVVV